MFVFELENKLSKLAHLAILFSILFPGLLSGEVLSNANKRNIIVEILNEEINGSIALKYQKVGASYFSKFPLYNEEIIKIFEDSDYVILIKTNQKSNREKFYDSVRKLREQKQEVKEKFEDNIEDFAEELGTSRKFFKIKKNLLQNMRTEIQEKNTQIRTLKKQYWQNKEENSSNHESIINIVKNYPKVKVENWKHLSSIHIENDLEFELLFELLNSSAVSVIVPFQIDTMACLLQSTSPDCSDLFD